MVKVLNYLDFRILIVLIFLRFYLFNPPLSFFQFGLFYQLFLFLLDIEWRGSLRRLNKILRLLRWLLWSHRNLLQSRNLIVKFLIERNELIFSVKHLRLLVGTLLYLELVQLVFENFAFILLKVQIHLIGVTQILLSIA